MNLPTLADVQQRRRAVPKHALPTRLKDTIAAKRKDDQQLAKFRAAVWTRDKGLCRCCGRKVIHTLALDPRRGEVHHLAGRRVKPEDRYVVAKAVLACRACHERLTRHEVTVPVVKT